MILALHIGHDATALLFDSGKIIAIAEERVKRIKNYYGFAFFAIDKIVSRANVQFSKIEKVVITSTSIKDDKSFKNIAFFKNRHEDFSNKVSNSAKIEFVANIFNKESFNEKLKRYLKKRVKSILEHWRKVLQSGLKKMLKTPSYHLVVDFTK